ncbi:EAL domain-containing protein [Rhizobium sp. S152]|uniref:sensor domain-containing phosphodiesterase n=1 Tax=Rhizobium sp. S152 TaxID=3055038 RepID=UPI0025A937C3|nr:EAL domain-containing protein [Rhizobium sp. S152]MDM9628024.1 EAL domain-containing protein [Rhizobium sp. S152]
MLQFQNAILEMIAKGEELATTIERLCRQVEARSPSIACSVLSVRNGRLYPIASPSLPADYTKTLEGTPIGPLVGSCGAAAYHGAEVAVSDIDRDGRWRNYRHLVSPLGFKACWSTPIFAGDEVVATFAFYFREARGPSELEREIVDACVHLCAIAIEREERVRERERLTYTDALTGLPNRARFNMVLAERGMSISPEWGLLLADVDNLKLVNDTFGHAAGDALIQTVARRLAIAASNHQIFRLGGDEFAAILDVKEAAVLAQHAEALIRETKRPAQCDGHVVFPAVTIGGAIAGREMAASQVQHNADIALYHGKERNRGEYTHYFAGLRTALTRRFRAIRDVGIALSENRIEAHYQPIVRLDTREIVGFEALARMRTIGGELVSAAHFHEATLDGHIAAQLTDRMIALVARDMRRWLDAGLPLQHVGINLSAADFRVDDLEGRVCGPFAAAKVPLDHLIMEVTESVYLGRGDHVVAEEIRTLRSRGLKVALDDFGTGFASLTHLLTVPVDIIKIDKSFTDRLVAADAATVIIEGVMSIASKLGIRVVAEGIETEPQADHLLSLACSLGQGYLFSKAVDRETATNLLETSAQPMAKANTGSR